MSTKYTALLKAQPANATLIYARRFTRDPPLLSRWLSLSFGALAPLLPTITIVGGTAAGTYATTYDPNWFATGTAAFSATIGGNKVAFWSQFGQGWIMEISDGLTWSIRTPQLPLTAGITGSNVITVFGTPTVTTPSAMFLGSLSAPLIFLPGSLIQSWRPQ